MCSHSNMKINCVDPEILLLMTIDFRFCNTEFPVSYRLRIMVALWKRKMHFLYSYSLYVKKRTIIWKHNT